jgi:peptidoglycan glycosyltransferase
LLAASAVIILLFVLAILNSGQPLTLRTLAVPLGLFVAFIISHLAVRWLAPNADPALLPLAFVLSGIGIAFVMRLAPSLAERQVIWLFMGIGAMIVVLLLVKSLRRLGQYKYTIMIVGLVLLLLPALIGVERMGSKIWLSFAGFSFQPGEIAKVLIVLFLAAYLADNREMLSASKRRVLGLNLPDFKTLTPLLLMWAVSLLVVVFERDLGSALLFFGIFLVMLYAATGRKIYVLTGVVLAAVGGVAAYALFDHVQTRVSIWLDPFADAQNAGFQLVQAFYSLADGDLFGAGIGRGLPTFIPIVESDFIFVAIAEEMGLLGAAAVILLFMLFAVRGLTIAARARSDFDAFTAVGLTAAISLQAFVIVGGVTGLIPLTGVTLPFMSQGGSSLLASFIIVGLLLRCSDSATGLDYELQGTTTIDGGVLGRVALGKRLTLLITLFALIFAVLIGNLSYMMMWRAPDIRNMASNNHTLAHQQNAQRGAIITADGVVLATSVDDGNGNYSRQYPQGSLAAHLVGYSSQQFAAAGIEASQQDSLKGTTHFSTWTEAIDALAGKSVPGNDVQLTLNSQIQQAAEAVLDGQTGGVVALDAQTGAVYACASAPTYDINEVETLLSGSASSDGDTAGAGPLFNRATQGLYAPGSTFKMVTLGGGLTGAGATLDSVYDAPGTLEIGNADVTNFGKNSFGRISLLNAFEVSSNTVFGQLAEQMGANTLVSTAERFGFNHELGQDFALSTSLMPDPAQMTVWETAWAGAGQPVGEHSSPAGPQATVMQMALVGGAIANNGTVMNPYVVDKIIGSNGAVLKTTVPVPFGEAVSPLVASQIATAMEGVVKQGTGGAAQIDGYTVRGKTGTAETNATVDNSWFVGYVELSDGRSVVVAVVLEKAPGGAAAPKARQVLEAAIDALE